MTLDEHRNLRNVTAARPFSFPHEVVEDPSLNLAEKRAILSEWASDACAVESFPILRWLPGTTFPVTFSAVMAARQQLDRIEERRRAIDESAIGHVVLADFAKKTRLGQRELKNASDTASDCH